MHEHGLMKDLMRRSKRRRDRKGAPRHQRLGVAAARSATCRRSISAEHYRGRRRHARRRTRSRHHDLRRYQRSARAGCADRRGSKSRPRRDGRRRRNQPASATSPGCACASRCAVRCRASASGRSSTAARRDLALTGWVTNTPEGVTIEAEGTRQAIDAWSTGESGRAPPNAVVAIVALEPLAPHGRARPSKSAIATGRRARARAILPDLATCEDCLAEILDPAEPPLPLSLHQLHALRAALRHRRRPALRPRAHDHARGFPMCAACRAEYEDPARPPLPRRAERLPGLRAAARAVGRRTERTARARR